MRVVLAAIAVLALAGGAARAAPPIAAYARLPATEFVRISPGGDRLAMITPLEDGRRVLLVRKVTGQPLFTGGFGHLKVRNLVWAGDNHVLAEVSNTMGEVSVVHHEAFALIAVNVDTGKVSGVLANAAEMMNIVFGYYGAHEAGGHTLIFVGCIPRAKMYGFEDHAVWSGLCRYDLDSGFTEVLEPSGERARDFVVVSGALSAQSVFDPTAGEERLFRGGADTDPISHWPSKGSLSDVSLSGAGRTGGTVLVDDESGPTDVFREVRLADGGPGVVVAGLTGAQGVLRHPVSDLAIGAATRADPGVRLFDPALQARLEKAVAAFPADHNVRLASFDAAFERLVLYVDGPGDSGGFWLVDAGAGAPSLIARTYPDVGSDGVGAARMFSFTAADGLAMEGVLTLPPGRPARNLPVVVLPHGGPIVEGDEARFDWWAQAIASRGYAVFQPNYRGTQGYGAAFRRAAEGEFGRKMQTDISDGLAALARAGIVDPARACIVGGSYGGYAALAGVTLQKGLYRCAVADAPVTDLRQFLFQTTLTGDPDRRAMHFWSTLAGPDLEAISPARFAARADAPILLIHGKDDTVVPIEQSRAMERALKSAGKSVEFVTMEGEDHWLSRPATRAAMLEACVAFLEKYNPPGP
jgi:acetyl esterase/lipase